MKLSRRDFLAIGAGLGSASCASKRSDVPTTPLVDFHVHLFGVGDGDNGAYLSRKQKDHWNYFMLSKLLDLPHREKIDQTYESVLVEQLRASSVTHAVLVGQDKRYDGNGAPDDQNTAFYVPNDYVFDVVERHADVLIPCVSINPSRRDAMDELERCAARGARVLKIHPPIQNVDPSEERFRPFYRQVAELDIVLMIHTGAEHSSVDVDDALSNPANLEPALEEGCIVVAAHAGMKAVFDDRSVFGEFVPNLTALAKRYPDLYCDISVLATMFRWRNVPELLDNDVLASRLVYASDFPLPSNALAFWNRMSPGRLLDLCSEKNLFERDLHIKQELGVPVQAFERGARLLGL